MNNIAIIYHGADFDGKLSNEVCRFWLAKLYPKATIHSYGWDYGQPVPVPLNSWFDPQLGDQFSNEWSLYDAIYIVDLSVDELMARPELRDKIVWIDHHKSAIEKWDVIQNEHETQYVQRPFKGTRIDGVAACRLCWAWFTWDKGQGYLPPLTKSVFIDREIKEPLLLRLAGEYDVWDHRDPDAKALQFGLRALSDLDYRKLVGNEFMGAVTGARTCSDELNAAIVTGRAIKSYCDKQIAEDKWHGDIKAGIDNGYREHVNELVQDNMEIIDALKLWGLRNEGSLVSNVICVIQLCAERGKKIEEFRKVVMDRNDGGPAFPAKDWKAKGNHHPGMTLRDYFAAAALQPLVTAAIELDHSKWDATAQHAYLIADAIIKAKEAKP